MTDLQPMEPGDAFAALGRIKLAETDLDSVLTMVAELAQRTIPDAHDVSVTLVRDNNARTAAFTGELSMILDEWQYEHGHGPCLDAAASSATLPVPDMERETRWADWAARAVRAGARSSLSIGLPIQEQVNGALNVYAVKPGAFDDGAVILAQTFAGYAAVALANAHTYDAQATLAAHLQRAMEHRAVIEQAKGIVMADRRCSPDDAFAVLSTLSQQTNTKLRDVAEILVARAANTPKA